MSGMSVLAAQLIQKNTMILTMITAPILINFGTYSI